MISKEHLLKICKELNLEFVEDNRPGYCHYIYLKHPMLKYDDGDIICEIYNEWQLHLFGKTYYWQINFPVDFSKDFDSGKYRISNCKANLGVLAPFFAKRFLRYYRLKLDCLATEQKRKEIKMKLDEMKQDFR